MKKDGEMKELLKLQHSRKKDRKQATTRRRRLGDAPPQKITDVLGSLFQADPEALKRIEETRALMAWETYVGDAAARVSKAIRLRSGTLVVQVRDPLWMQQLSLLKHGLIRRYRQAFPKLELRDIFFTTR